MKTAFGIIIICFVFSLGCTMPPPDETYVEAAIPVTEERISLSPLISEAQIEKLPDWPADPSQQRILLNSLNGIWNLLLAEFRRCQKYGLYTIVDDNDNPTMRISIVLTPFTYNNDTLSLPVRLQAERLRDDQRFTYTLPAFAYLPPPGRKLQSYHFYGQLLTDYRRRFPYAVLVSFFYRHKIP